MKVDPSGPEWTQVDPSQCGLQCSAEVEVRSHMMKDIGVREILLKEHLAEFATESYNSQKNHEERRNFKFQNEHMQKHLNSFAAQQTCVSTVKPQNEVAKQQLKVFSTLYFGFQQYSGRSLFITN